MFILKLMDHTKKELSLMEKSDKLESIEDALIRVVRILESRCELSEEQILVTSTLLQRLAQRLPLTSLTGDESEWSEIGDNLEVNTRCFSVVRKNKDNSTAQDLERRIVVKDGKMEYASTPITFPYTPPISPSMEMRPEEQDKFLSLANIVDTL
ncbi:hypothetical protein LIS04_152 [Listeria phage LIS04]|nr:hypothetical protein LIS04_152 [Listeria phage LIS04]